MNELLAITREQASRLTGLSLRQLSYWDETGFFSPSWIDEQARWFGRLYNFRDVVGLRTIAILRRDHRISLQELRKVGKWLHEQHETPWASLTLYVAGRQVYFKDPSSAAVFPAHPEKQVEIEVALEQIAHDVQRKADELRARGRDQIGRVVRHRNVVHNAWCIAGTRIPTAAIRSFADAGYKAEAIIRQYPSLKVADVKAALSHERRRERSG